MKYLITLIVALSILDNGNWILNLDGEEYHLDYYWIGEQRVVKTYGEGVCYWTYMLNNELVQTDCN